MLVAGLEPVGQHCHGQPADVVDQPGEKRFLRIDAASIFREHFGGLRRGQGMQPDLAEPAAGKQRLQRRRVQNSRGTPFADVGDGMGNSWRWAHARR